MRGGHCMWLAAVLASCVGQVADTSGPRLVSSSPAPGETEVALDAVVRLSFSEPLGAAEALSEHAAVLVEGVPTGPLLADLANPPVSRPGVVACERWLEAPTVLVLRAKRGLAPRAPYSAVLTRSLRDRSGNRLLGAPVVVSFTTAGADVELVVPEGPAPPNLSEVVVRHTRAPTGPPQPDDLAIETSRGEPVPSIPADGYPGPRWRGVRLLSPLAPGGTYVARVRSEAGQRTLPFAVGSVADDRPPRWLRVEARPFDGALEVDASLDEPAWVTLFAGRGASALREAARSPYGREHRLRIGGLAEGERVYYRLTARDAAGHESQTPRDGSPPASRVVHAALRVEINEVVADPKRDWGDGACNCGPCGVPFDSQPGCDPRVGAKDEWVELANRSGRTLDLTAGPEPWRLRVVDATPEVTVLEPGRAVMYFAPGSAAQAWRPEGLLVVKTAGSTNHDARIELVDPWGSVVDAVQLGRGGVPGGAAAGPEDEAVARTPEGAWCRAPATPGLPNPTECAGP